MTTYSLEGRGAVVAILALSALLATGGAAAGDVGVIRRLLTVRHSWKWRFADELSSVRVLWGSKVVVVGASDEGGWVSGGGRRWCGQENQESAQPGWRTSAMCQLRLSNEADVCVKPGATTLILGL